MVKDSRKKIRFRRSGQMCRLPNLRIRLLIHQRKSLQPNQVSHTRRPRKPTRQHGRYLQTLRRPSMRSRLPTRRTDTVGRNGNHHHRQRQMQRLRLVHRSLRLRRNNAASRNQSRLRLRPLQGQSRRSPMRQMVSRRSPHSCHKRRASTEGKNQRNQETIPRKRRVNENIPCLFLIFKIFSWKGFETD